MLWHRDAILRESPSSIWTRSLRSTQIVTAVCVHTPYRIQTAASLYSASSGSLSQTVEHHFSGLMWTASQPDMQKIWIIGFFFENRLHWQFEVRLLLFTVRTRVLIF